MPSPLYARMLPHASLAGVLLALSGCPFSHGDHGGAQLLQTVSLPEVQRTTVEQVGSLSFIASAATESAVSAREVEGGNAAVVFSLLGDLYRLSPTGGAAERITSGPAFDTDPCLSRDGSLVAFRSDRGGLSGIYTVPIQGGEVQELTVGSEHTHLLPVFSPDNRDVIYVRFRGANPEQQAWELVRQPAGGGLKQVLGSLPRDVTGMTINKSGQLFYTVSRRSKQGAVESHLYLFPEQTTRQTLPGILAALQPHPAGGLLARWQEADRASRQDLVWVKPGTGEMEVLRALAQGSSLPRFGWLEGRQQIVLSDEGKLRLLRPNGSLAGEISFTAQVDVPVQPRVGDMKRPPMRRHGRVQLREDLGMFYAAAGRIWFLSNVPNQGSQVSLSGEEEVAYDPALSPDGRALVYCRLAGAGAELVYLQLPANLRTDSTAPPKKKAVLYASAGLTAPSFTRDGRRVLLTATDGAGQSRIVRVATTGGPATALRVQVGAGVAASPIPSGLCYGAPAYVDPGAAPLPRGFLPGAMYRASEQMTEGRLVTALPPTLTGGACSIDGRFVAYIYDGAVWVAHLRTDRPVRDGEGVRVADMPTLDANSIGFTSSGKLMVIRGNELRLIAVAEFLSAGGNLKARDQIFSIPQDMDVRPHTPLWIQDITLIDPERRTSTPHTTLVIDGRRIRYVGPKEQAPPPFREAILIPGEHRYALPGLIDTQTHLGVYGPSAYLHYGITTALDLGGNSHVDDLSAAGEAGHAKAPAAIRAMHLSAGTEAGGLSRTIEMMARSGASFLLLDGRLPRNIRRSACKLATEHGMRVAAHGDTIEAVSTAVLDGASLLLTQLAGDAPYYEDVVGLLARSGVSVSSLLWPRGLAEQALRRGYPSRNVALFEQVVPQEAIAAHKALVFGRAQVPADAAQLFRAAKTTPLDLKIEQQLSQIMKLQQAGVRVVAGSGAGTPGCFPGVSLLWEIAALGQAGLTRYDALRAATVDAARALGAADSGRVGVGMRGDVLVVSGNPLDDLRQLEQVVLTVRGGRVYRPEVMLHSSVPRMGSLRIQ